jgi:predicted transcriptional regulator
MEMSKDDKEKEELWAAIRYLSEFSRMMVINIIRENQPLAFTALKKKTAMPKEILENILKGLSEHHLIIKEAGDIQLTIWGDALLGALDKLLKDEKLLTELAQKMKEAESGK